MRFDLTLARKNKSRFIPIDYQYFIGAWIYKVLGKADKELAQFVHGTGYGEGNKRFKLFNYSPLTIKPGKFWKEKGLLEILGNEINLQVSFHIDDVAAIFIKGLFMNQEVYLGDRFNGAELVVSKVETLRPPKFSETMQYMLLSPCVISIKENKGNARYLAPDENIYREYFLKHLAQKQYAIFKTANENEEGHSLEEYKNWSFSAKDHYKSKLHTIKPGTKEQTKVRGFLYDFDLTAPVEIHEMAWNCGFGEKNSVGFGWATKEN